MAFSIPRHKSDFWTWITISIIAILCILLILPILRVLTLGFVDPDTGNLTLGNFIEVFTRNYYLNGLKNTLFVGVARYTRSLPNWNSTRLFHHAILNQRKDPHLYSRYFGASIPSVHQCVCLDYDDGIQWGHHELF